MTTRQMNFILLAAVITMALQGCGSSNSKAPSVNASGKHPADWYTAHRNAFSTAFIADGAQQCKECHGVNLDGGIASVNCTTGLAGFPAGPCHANGHGPRVTHQLPFKAANLHGPQANADIAGCGACHATGTVPGSNPRFNVTIGSLTNGCEDCHKTGTAHPPVDPAKVAGFPASWNNHAAAGNIAGACTLCHGSLYQGGSGPACSSCHNRAGAVMPPVAGQCVSCHAKPPATGSHAAHSAVASIATLCTACHDGAGSGTPRHGSRGFANVSTAISQDFAAKTGSGSVTASLTCRNIRCHGGVTTPPWGTGAINAAAECIACHTQGTASQTPQYNSYFSGQHSRHVNSIRLQCTDCHDMSVSSGSNSHFSNMATPIFELSPGLTIRGPVNYSGGRCSPGNNPAQFSVGVCHGSESWQ
ncbi:class III cytochrome C family protein [Geobacter sp. OR-1]|uniref:CxxxxCH/CxxCH domain-containing protein n=1 Tax=Geobacter sp. OR-1 TaxID=1266765 RepID=UPI000542F527|nr:CxxxxCH/CxxCH domain-containing protein [Geobacter sp. OR-1]GAM07812.1 class III cytochrome C family protein [Geobacter sp. OR-1]